MFKNFLRSTLLILISLVLTTQEVRGQCDVFIEPGTIQVVDNGTGVQFLFDITNNSAVDYDGGTLNLYWTLNSSAPLWDIDFTTNTIATPITPGETRSIKTPWFDFPNIPSWFPSDPNASQPWVESQEWPFYGLSFPFQGSWSPMILKLDGCGNDFNGDNIWDNVVYDSNGNFYYGPTNSDCPNANIDQFCDCEIDFLDFNHYTYEATLQVNGWQNCATPLNNGLTGDIDEINSIVFGMHVPGWDFGWGCTSPDLHPGWTFMLFSNLGIDGPETITLNLDNNLAVADCWLEIFEDVDLPCREIVLWQINYSKTATIFDFPEDGWAVNPSTGNNTIIYPDIDITDNRINYCNTPNAYPLSNGLDVTCVNNEPFWTYEIRVINNGLDTLFTYCVEIPELGYDECFDGYVQSLYWIAPNQGQYLDEITIPTEITEFTVNVYNAGDELDEFFFDNSIVVTINSEANDICEVNGCTDPLAENYNPLATLDDGSCEYLVDIGIDSLTYQLGGCFGEPMYWIPQINMTNYGVEPITEFCVTFDILSDGLPEDTLCFENLNILQGETYMVSFPENTNGTNTPIVVSLSVIDVNGENTFPFFYFGQDDVLDNNTSVHIFEMWCYDCIDPEADNYNEYATDNTTPNNCEYLGCTDVNANNYDSNANVDDGSCEYLGCTDPQAFNYDPNANIDDGSCQYEGCTDPDALNYDPTATIDNGSCLYDVYGCTDVNANNYNPDATVDDGSCTYDIFGCTDPNADNYNPNANVDDGSCNYDVYGCTNSEALNYNSNATIDDGTCIYPGPCDEFEGDAFAPNAFTPNNDGLNDAWRVLTDEECWRTWELIIYNRWGQVVYEMDEPSQVWDGSFRGGDHYVTDGVYAYTLRSVAWNLKSVEVTGFITVLR